MATPIMTGNYAAQDYLKNRFISHRWRGPFVTEQRMSKQEARARAFAEMRARVGR